jgi:NADH-quinone oxidoreductase subunit N
VLVEAFAPRTVRHERPGPSRVVRWSRAFAVLVLKSRHDQGATLGAPSVIDGPALFLQGSVLVLAAARVM